MSTARTLALQALKNILTVADDDGRAFGEIRSLARTAIAALEAETGEPVAYRVYDPVAQSEDLYFEDDLGDMDGKEITPLYAAPIEHAAWVDGSKKSTLPIYRGDE